MTKEELYERVLDTKYDLKEENEVTDSYLPKVYWKKMNLQREYDNE